METWIEAARSNKKLRAKKSDTKEGDTKELIAMERVLLAFKSSEEDLTKLAKSALSWITQAGDLYWLQQSNIDPNYEINERILLKFWDWKFSPTGIEEKRHCGKLAMSHRCQRLKDLGHSEPTEKSWEEVISLKRQTVFARYLFSYIAVCKFTVNVQS